MFDYKGFLGLFPSWRRTKLKKKKRYVAFNVFFYRSSLWLHHWRVAAMIQEMADVIRLLLPDCDVLRTWTGSLFHDDHELIGGDIPLFYKEAMSPEEKKALQEMEMVMAEQLAKQFPQMVNGYNYYQLLLNMICKDSLEAKVISYFDKLDAYCEALHEHLAGNYSALYPVMDYPKRIYILQQKYSELAPLFSRKDIPLLNIDLRGNPDRIRYEDYAHFGQHHTEDLLKIKTDFLFYNCWRTVVQKHLGKQGRQWLTTKSKKPTFQEVPQLERKMEPQAIRLALVS